MSRPRGDARAAVDSGIAEARPPRATPVGSWRVGSARDLTSMRAGLLEALAAAAPDGGHALDEHVVLVASELATNALRHGAPPAHVRLLSGRGALVLEVADGDTERVPVLAGRRTAGAGGFGLVIAERVARDVGWYRASGAKHVWALFPLG
ncbi:ATP-binding protein [Cellulomonas endophytica]|uniref:ATP-binding protein n=1 Tax=Cellulomonas endophytica TaxID=2494735 RepID=UPI00101324DF|nr:ATP-binding protein [Cellulomonas endophytica]